MDRPELEWELRLVDDEREPAVPRACSIADGSMTTPVLVVHRVAVMAVGDQRLMGFQRVPDGMQLRGVGDGPDPVERAVARDDIGERGLLPSPGDALAGGRVAVVHEQDRFEVRL